jgi:hypothetical protein
MRYGRKNTAARNRYTVGLDAAERYVTPERLDAWNELRRLAGMPTMTQEEAVRRVMAMFNPEFEGLQGRIERHQKQCQAIEDEVGP